MQLTVIVCTYNRATLLRQTLAALAAQELPASIDWDLVVVDNNSSDDTRATIENFARTAPMPTRYLFETRQGLSYARNTGIEAGGGEIVAFTDDDVVPEPHWVFRTVSAVRDHAADGVGGRILPRWSAPPPTWLSANPILLTLIAMQEFDQEAVLTQTNLVRIFGANMAFRRDLFGEIGVFDTAQGRVGAKLSGGDDTDFVQRAVAAGRRIVYDPGLVVWHHVGPERLHKRYFRKWRFDVAENEALRSHAVPGRALFGVPLYFFRVVPTRVGQWLIAWMTRHPSAFDKELAVFANLGFAAGFARRWWRLASHRGSEAHVR